MHEWCLLPAAVVGLAAGPLYAAPTARTFVPSPVPAIRWYTDAFHDGRFPALPTGLEYYATPTFGMNSFGEMQRLFGIQEGDDDPEMERLGTKALFALPLLRRGNLLEILLRPQTDLYGTYATRAMIDHVAGGDSISAPEGSVAVDLHVHTCYSHDSLAAPEDTLLAAARAGLNGVAITDHDTLEGARKAGERADHLIQAGRLPDAFFVIPGEEISTLDGHVIGLFLTSEIRPGMSAAETVAQIHRQGGLAVAAHPEMPDGLGALAKTLPFDAVETINAAEETRFAGARTAEKDRRAAFYADVTTARLGVSDAHVPRAVGMAYTLVETPNRTAAGVRAALLQGRAMPVDRATGGESLLARRGPFRWLLSLMNAAGDGGGGLDGRLRRATHATTVHASFWPAPGLEWSRQF